MPRTIESIVENHKVAAERRAAGKPVWDRTVKIRHLLTEEDSPENAAKVGAAIASILRAKLPSRWFDPHSDEFDDDIDEIAYEMSRIDAADPKALDSVNLLIDELYDWADANRVWIA